MRVVTVSDGYQSNYTYELIAREGQDFADDFAPAYSPQEMLEMGVFEGKYYTDGADELPSRWFADAKLSATANPSLNFFGVKSRQSLSEWKAKGWIIGPDPRGWFQWYCRYYLGRRIPDVDAAQIKRWRGFARHAGQIRANCYPGDLFCRPRQRQALLQWAHDAML